MPLTISAQQGLINQYDYFDKQIASLNLSNYYIIKKGEFAYNKSYSNGYPYGAIKRLDFFEQGALSSLYICFSISNINSDYLVRYFDSGKWNKQVKLISGEGARNHGLLNLSPDDFFNISIMIPPSKEEQMKISHFLNLINSKIKYMDEKIEALKKYRKGLIQIGLKQVYSSGSFVRFSDLYVDISERNIDSFNQYTVGKEGLKPILESNYDLQNHKIFQPNCLLIGIGIEEIAVSVNDSGSVSPVYNVYKINDKDYLNYTRFFLKPILWRKKAFITRKSTRREYEIDTKELLRFNLPVPFDLQFDKVCNSIESLDILIQQLTNKLKQLNRVKSYLLKNMFM